MPDPIELELQRHTAALRRLARGLVGEHAADDLVQDTVVQALQAPAPPRSWGAWLVTVLRFLAHKHHRTESRRQRREGAREPLADAPPAEQPIEQGETLRRLTDAVLALPQPYREAVLLRYLRECTPAQIAAETGASLATVKSRLQRGLVLLRDGLAARSPRQDWRLALVSAFALDRATATKVAAGGIFMAIGTKWMLGVAVLLLAVVTLEWNRAAATNVAPAAPRSDANAAVADAPARTDAGEQRTAAAAPPEAPWLSVRGRCVDPDGEPVPGVTAQLRDPSRSEAGPAASVVTGADGTFNLRRAPVEGTKWSQTLVLRGPRRCTVAFEELRGTVGAELDVGDVTLLPAVVVQGRLVDRRGAPVAGAELNVWHATIGSSAGLTTMETLRTGADGRFGPSIGLPPGRGRIAGETCILAGEIVGFDLDLLQPIAELELTAVDRSELPGIAGTVVDEAGVPIEGASVHLLHDTATTARDGTFRVVRSEGQFGPGPFRLQVWAEDREGFFGPFALGRTDARIVLPLHPALQVRVRRADDGRPLETFALVAWLQHGKRRPHDLAAQSWPLGVASAGRLPRGEYVVSVVPSAGELAPVTSLPFLLHGDTTIDVEVPAAGSRMLAITDAEGRALEGIDVELLQPNGAPLTVDANAADFADMTYVEPTSPLRLQRGRTDANGELLLRGPLGRPLALRLGGPGPVQTLVQPIRLDPTARLEHRMPATCEFRGRLVPPDVVKDLMHDDRGALRTGVGGLGLVVHTGGVPRYALTGPRVVVAPDGTFATTLPAGRWQLTLLYDVGAFALGAIDARPGGAPAEIDVSAFRRSDVELRLSVDGEPLAYGSVDCVLGHGPLGTGGTHWMDTRVTDHAGRVRLRMLPGVLTAMLHLPPDGAMSRLGVIPALGVVVPGGTSVAHTIDVKPGAIEIRVRTPSGAPAVGVPLRLLGTGVKGPDLLPTDGAGVARGNRLDAGRYTVLTVPRSHGCDLTTIARDAWFAVGTVDVRAGGAEHRTEITLPRAWDR